MTTDPYSAIITEIPTRLDGWETAIEQLLASDTPEPARSYALSDYADRISDTAWHREHLPRARSLSALARAGVNPDADLLDGQEELVRAGRLSITR